MDTRMVASEYRLTQWGQIIQARLQSGQSIKDFCENSGISRNTYFFWQRKLRQAACAEFADKTASAETGLVPDGWSRLEPAASAQSNAVNIAINGCRVEVTGDTDPELLARVCRALKTL